jgi:hypothetical protein
LLEYTLELIKNNSVIFIIALTIINIFFVYKNYLFNQQMSKANEKMAVIATEKRNSEKAVIDIKLKNLPPYKTENDRTHIILKNIGNDDTRALPIVLLSCSWTPGISHKLNFPSGNSLVSINEEFQWKLRLPGNPPEGATIELEADDPKGFSWHYHESI